MPLLLNIDTATSYASVCISNNEEILAFADSADQKDHASFLHVAIKNLLEKSNILLNNIDAISITSGPGSYTGLRVGMASAKGICYALSKPLICLNTLEVMAYAALQSNEASAFPGFICPMIDARRMEVFTAVYERKTKDQRPQTTDDRPQATELQPSITSHQLSTILPPCAMVLEPGNFDAYLAKGPVTFFGNGAEKYTSLVHNLNSRFASVQHSAINMVQLANALFYRQYFTDIAYASPDYFKEFYSTAGNK